MAKGKVVHKTVTVKRKGSRKTSSVGGASTKNYAVKYRNIDYKYRLVDLDETYSETVFQKLITQATAEVNQFGATGQQAFLAGLKSMCYFIPLTTFNGVCRNMNVNIKCKYPFAYCVFQNTTDFYKYVFDYCVTRQVQINNAQFQNFYCGNCGQKSNSIMFMPMGRTAGEDLLYLGNDQWQEGVNILFAQLCQKQSTYKEVYSATNSGLYTANVNVYYRKASQFLSGPLSSIYFQGYDDIQKQYDNLTTMYSKTIDSGSGLLVSKQVQDMFKPGDMTLCILPMWFFYNKMLDSTKLPPSGLTVYPFSFEVKRRIYRLNQDNGLAEAAERVINNKATNTTQTVTQTARVPSAGTQGNVYPTSIEIIRQIQKNQLGRKVVRAELDTISENTNCVIVDSNCYDPNTETLQMQAYMDLQPNAPTAGTSILNNYENEETMNCNVITQAANVDFEQTNQIVQLPYVRQGAFSAADSASIQQSNTGPYLVKVTNDTFHYNVFPFGDSTRQNFVYNYGLFQAFGSAYQDVADQSITFYHGSPAPGSQHRFVSYVNRIGPFTSFQMIEDNIETLITQLQALGVLVQIGVHQGTYDAEHGYLTCNLAGGGTNTYYGYQATGSADKVYLQIHVFYGTQQQDGLYYVRMAPGCLCATYDGTQEQYDAHAGEAIFSFTMITALQFLNLLTSPVAYAYDATGSSEQSYYYLTLSDFVSTTLSTDINNDGLKSLYVTINPQTSQPDVADAKSRQFVSQYMNQWIDMYQKCYPQESKKGWKRFKGFLSKCWKFIKNAIPIAKKVTQAVSTFIPAPYGTTVCAVADKVEEVVTNLDTLSLKKTSSSVAAAVMDDDTNDVFEVTPQYRISESAEPVDIGATGTDWVDGESFEQPVNASGVQINKGIRFDLTRHPVYGELIRQRALGLASVQDSSRRLYMQQRLKVRFIKRCSQQIANAYKAILTLGNDTNYFTPDDYTTQTVTTN